MLRHIVFSASSSRGWIENELLKWRRSLRQSGLVFARLATMHQMPSGSFASAQDKIEEMDEEGREEDGVTDFSAILVNVKCLWIMLPRSSLCRWKIYNLCLSFATSALISLQLTFYLILQYGTRDGGFGEGWIILRGHGKDGVMNLLVLSPPPHTNCGVTRVMKGNGISLTLSL